MNAKGRTRAGLFVDVLFGPSRAQISSTLLVHVGHCLCVFVLVVALIVALLREVVKETIFLGVCCDASMGREGALCLKLIYLYP